MGAFLQKKQSQTFGSKVMHFICDLQIIGMLCVLRVSAGSLAKEAIGVANAS